MVVMVAIVNVVMMVMTMVMAVVMVVINCDLVFLIRSLSVILMSLE